MAELNFLAGLQKQSEQGKEQLQSVGESGRYIPNKNLVAPTAPEIKVNAVRFLHNEA